jgi:hypothetical protein
MVFLLVLVHGLLLVIRNIGVLSVCKFYLLMRTAFLWRNLDIFHISMKVSVLHALGNRLILDE